MHTMFTKYHRSSNASAQAEAAATIAATMASNCSNALEGSNVIQNSNLSALAASIASNPISSYFNVGKVSGSAGPELAWRLFDATRISDGKEVTIWFFDRKWVEKKSAKRVDFIIDRLKRGAVHLDRCRHAKIVSVYNQLIEANDTLAFATEPILGSLANITGYLEDRLRQGIQSSLRIITFNDFEIKYGLLQIAEALVFIHHTCKSIHGNICPQSIIVNKFLTWKLAGLEFLDKNEEDPLLPVNCLSFTTKYPKMSQVDLDFSAPEIQCSNACSQQSDMFSLGLLICCLFNNGRSPIQANLNIATYLKQLETLNANVEEIADRMPPALAQYLSLTNNSASLVNPASSKRLTSSQFVKIPYFDDTGVRGLQCLDIIYLKDNMYKATFYQNLKHIMDLVPKKLWFQHILPHLESEFENAEISAAALEPVLHIIQFCTLDEYQNHIFPLIKKIQLFPKSVQATIILLENINILKQKTGERHIKDEILPMLISGIQSPVHQIQCAALKAFSEVIDHIDEKTIREILPKAQSLLRTNDSNVQLQNIVLLLVDRLVGSLEKSEQILDEILPTLLTSKLTDPIVLRPTIHIYQQLLNNKLVGLNVTILATQVMPSLTPSLVSASLTINDFNNLADLLQVMLNIINKSQRNKLKLERMSSYSVEKQYPNNFDQPLGYAHRPPNLRLQTRRQSISVDNVQRPSISLNCSSPEINYLRVSCNLPYRRHSDNAIEAPRILINHANNSSSSVHINSNYNYQSNSNINSNLTIGANNAMPKRRHSSVNPQEVKSVSSNVYNFFNQARNFTKNSVTGSGSALNNLLSSSQSRVSGSRYAGDRRRYSTQSIFTGSPTASSNFLNQIGSNVQSLFSKY